jgi:hypothetical protein
MHGKARGLERIGIVGVGCATAWAGGALATAVVVAALASVAPAGLTAQSPARRLAVTLTHSVGSSTSAHPPPCGPCTPGDVLAPVSVSTLELEMAIPLGSRTHTGLEYHLRVVPLAVMRNNPAEAARREPNGWSLPPTTERASNLGIGVKPAGLRAWVDLGPMRAEADASGGLLLFRSAALAANAAHLNFVGEAGVGLRLPWPARGGLVVGYRRHHVSNAGLAEVNPGLDSHVLYLSVPLR